MTNFLDFIDDDRAIPSILVVGCGRVGENIVKAFVDSSPPSTVKIYVTDSDRERARKLSEYRLSSIIPIRWRYAHDTPDEVDLIVVAVDHDSEHKVIDRLVLASRPFISLTDDSTTYDAYEEYQDEFKENNINGVLGTGLIPGIANVLVKHASIDFDRVLDITVERLGFVSASSLASIKRARRDQPLSVRDGILSESKRMAGTCISWFPPPHNSIECQSVAVGVKALKKSYPDAHNISVRIAEPKLPTFNERLRRIFLQEPLTTKRACVRAEIHGISNGEIKTQIFAISGDALNMITHMSIQAIVGVFNCSNSEIVNKTFLSCNDVVNEFELLTALHNSGSQVARFDGILD